MFNQANSIINKKSRESCLINTNIPKKINNQFLNQFEKNIKNDNGNNQNISNNKYEFQNKNINIEINKKKEFDKNVKKEEIIVENEINNEEENKKEIIENGINKKEENKEEIILEKEMNKDEEISKIHESFDSISTSSTLNQKKSPFLDSITLDRALLDRKEITD